MKCKKIILYLCVGLIATEFCFLGGEKQKPGISSLENFRKIIILEGGRKKPLDTFAQNWLKQFSGRSRYQNESAIFWFSRVLFVPEKANQEKIFLINHMEVLNSVGIDGFGERARYSFSQLATVLPRLKDLAFSASRIEGDERTAVENEIIFLYNKIYLYQQFIKSFQFAMAREDFKVSNPELKKLLKLPEDRENFSFFNIFKNLPLLDNVRLGLQKKTETSWSSLEKEIWEILKMMEQRIRCSQDSTLAIVLRLKNGEENWLSPGEILNQSFSNLTAENKEITLIHDFVNAFLKGDPEEFDRSVKLFNEFIHCRLEGKQTYRQISWEVFYNKIDPFCRSQFFYGLSLFFFLISLLMLKKLFYQISFFLLLSGWVFHTLGIISRMVIMERPPVTNLYETFVFTGWMAVVMGIILEFFKKKNIGLLTGSISGIILLLIAGKYALEGDTLGMLVAVLDSNFWLSTHVITITVGFSGIVVSGIIGHVYIIQKIFFPDRKDSFKNLFQSIYSTQAFGLIFTFLGTVLGGMWADQSWGRFWGWDPKENGALVVVLWSVILFHSRLTKWIGETGFSLGAIVGIIGVALSWFGINLLGVGLHSYGFTSGIALALFIFIIIEFIFVLIGGFYLKKNRSG